MPQNTYALLARRRSSSSDATHPVSQSLARLERDGQSSVPHGFEGAQQLLGRNPRWDVRSSATDSLERAVAIVGAPTRHFGALKDGWAPVEEPKAITRLSGRTRQGKELRPESTTAAHVNQRPVQRIQPARKTMQALSSASALSQEPIYWKRQKPTQAGGPDAEQPTIIKRLVHASGTGAGGLLDLAGEAKQPNGRWTTRSFRSRMESSCVLELQRRSQTNIAIVADFQDAPSTPHTVFLEHAAAPTMPFRPLAQHCLTAAEGDQGGVQHVFQPGANATVSRYLRIRFVGHRDAFEAGAGTRAHRLQLLKVVSAEALESRQPDAALPLSTRAETAGCRQHELQPRAGVAVDNHQTQGRASLLPAAALERKASPGRSAKRGKEQIAPEHDKGQTSDLLAPGAYSRRSAASSKAHGALGVATGGQPVLDHASAAPGQLPASRQLPARAGEIGSQRGHAPSGALEALSAGDMLPASSRVPTAKEPLRDRFARLRRLRPESLAATAREDASGTDQAGNTADSGAGTELATSATDLQKQPAGDGGRASLLPWEKPSRGLASHAGVAPHRRPLQSVRASEISASATEAPAASTEGAAGSSLQVRAHAELSVDTSSSALHPDAARESPNAFRRSPQGVSPQHRGLRNSHGGLSRAAAPDGTLRLRKREQLLARLRVFAKRHWPFKKRSRSCKGSPLSRKASPQPQLSPSTGGRPVPVSHFSAWPAGNKDDSPSSPAFLAADRQLPAFASRSKEVPEEGSTAESQLQQQIAASEAGKPALCLPTQEEIEQFADGRSSPALIDYSNATQTAEAHFASNSTDGASAQPGVTAAAEAAQAVQGDDPSQPNLIHLCSTSQPEAQQAIKQTPEETSEILTAAEGVDAMRGAFAASCTESWAVIASPESKPLNQFRLQRRRSSIAGLQDLQELQAQLEATAKATEELLSKGRWSRLSPHKERAGGIVFAEEADRGTDKGEGTQPSRLAEPTAAKTDADRAAGQGGAAGTANEGFLVERELSFGAGCWGRGSRGPSRDGSAPTSVATSPTEDTRWGLAPHGRHAVDRASLDLWAPRTGAIPEESPSEAVQSVNSLAEGSDVPAEAKGVAETELSSTQVGHSADTALQPSRGGSSEEAYADQMAHLMRSSQHSMFTFDASPGSQVLAAAERLPGEEPPRNFQEASTEQSTVEQTAEIKYGHTWNSLAAEDLEPSVVCKSVAKDISYKAEEGAPLLGLEGDVAGDSKPARLVAVGSSQDSDSLVLSPIQQPSSRQSVARAVDIANPLWESWEGKLASLANLTDRRAGGLEWAMSIPSETNPKSSQPLSPIQEAASTQYSLPSSAGAGDSSEQWLWTAQPASEIKTDAGLSVSDEEPETEDDTPWRAGSAAEQRCDSESPLELQSASVAESSVAESPSSADSPEGEAVDGRRSSDVLVELRMCHSPRLQERDSQRSSRAGRRGIQLQDDLLGRSIPASWDASVFGPILSPGPLQQGAPARSLQASGPKATGSTEDSAAAPRETADQSILPKKTLSPELKRSKAGPLGNALAASKEYGSKVFSDSPLAVTAFPDAAAAAHGLDWTARSLINSWDVDMMGTSGPTLPGQASSGELPVPGVVASAVLQEPWGALFDSVDVDRSTDWPHSLRAARSIPGPLMSSLGGLGGFRPTAMGGAPSANAETKPRTSEPHRFSRASLLAAGPGPPSFDVFEQPHTNEFSLETSQSEIRTDGGSKTPAEGPGSVQSAATQATSPTGESRAAAALSDPSFEAFEQRKHSPSAQKGSRAQDALYQETSKSILQESAAGSRRSCLPTHASLREPEQLVTGPAHSTERAGMENSGKARNSALRVDDAYRIADPFGAAEMEKMFQVLPDGASGFSLALAQAHEAQGGRDGGRVRRHRGGSSEAPRQARQARSAPKASLAPKAIPASNAGSKGQATRHHAQGLRSAAVGTKTSRPQSSTDVSPESYAPKKSVSPVLAKAPARREPLWQAFNRRSLEDSEEGLPTSGESPSWHKDIMGIPGFRAISSTADEGLIRAHRPRRTAVTQGQPVSAGSGQSRWTRTPDSAGKLSPWSYAPLAKGLRGASKPASDAASFQAGPGSERRRKHQAKPRRPFR